MAIELPEIHKAHLARLQDRLAPDAPGLRWESPYRCHITLAFLGDVPDAELDAVCHAVATAVAPFTPFELELAGLGAFPNPSQARILWAGLVGPEIETLHRLRAAIVSALKSVGSAPADDRFTPHATLGRIKSGRRPAPNLTGLLTRHKDWSAGTFPVSEVITFASVLAPSGPTYTPLSRGLMNGEKHPAVP